MAVVHASARVLEACSYDVRTHGIAGDVRGLIELSDVLALASSGVQATTIALDCTPDRWPPSCPRILEIEARARDLGPLMFSATDARLIVVGGRRALGVLARSLTLLAHQERRVEYSSPRLAPRWYDGDDFLVRDSDEITFYQLPIDPPLRGARGGQ